MKSMHRSLLTLLLPILLRCLGGGTETTNGVSGAISFTDDHTSQDPPALAALFSVDYRPDLHEGHAETTFVDADGRFRFDPPAEQRYNLFVWDTLNRLGAMIADLPADTLLGSVALEGTGTILFIPLLSANENRATLVIPGSPFYCETGWGAAEPQITLIPAGTYPVDISVEQVGPGTPPETVTIDPETADTVKLSYP